MTLMKDVDNEDHRRLAAETWDAARDTSPTAWPRRVGSSADLNQASLTLKSLGGLSAPSSAQSPLGPGYRQLAARNSLRSSRPPFSPVQENRLVNDFPIRSGSPPVAKRPGPPPGKHLAQSASPTASPSPPAAPFRPLQLRTMAGNSVTRLQSSPTTAPRVVPPTASSASALPVGNQSPPPPGPRKVQVGRKTQAAQKGSWTLRQLSQAAAAANVAASSSQATSNLSSNVASPRSQTRLTNASQATFTAASQRAAAPAAPLPAVTSVSAPTVSQVSAPVEPPVCVYTNASSNNLRGSAPSVLFAKAQQPAPLTGMLNFANRSPGEAALLQRHTFGHSVTSSVVQSITIPSSAPSGLQQKSPDQVYRDVSMPPRVSAMFSSDAAQSIVRGRTTSLGPYERCQFSTFPARSSLMSLAGSSPSQSGLLLNAGGDGRPRLLGGLGPTSAPQSGLMSYSPAPIEPVREEDKSLSPPSAVKRHQSAPPRGRWNVDLDIPITSQLVETAVATSMESTRAPAADVVVGSSASMPAQKGYPHYFSPSSIPPRVVSQASPTAPPVRSPMTTQRSPQLRLPVTPVITQGARERASSPINYDVQVRCGNSTGAPVMRFQSYPDLRPSSPTRNGMRESAGIRHIWASPPQSPLQSPVVQGTRSVGHPMPGHLRHKPASSLLSPSVGSVVTRMSSNRRFSEAMVPETNDDVSFHAGAVISTASLFQGEQGDALCSVNLASENCTPVAKHRSVPALRTPQRLPFHSFATHPGVLEDTPASGVTLPHWHIDAEREELQSLPSRRPSGHTLSCPTEADTISPRDDAAAALLRGLAQAVQPDEDVYEEAPRERRCVRCLAGSAFVVGAYSLAGRKAIFTNWVNQDVHLVLPLGRHLLLACVFDGHGLNGHIVAGLISNVFEQNAPELFLPPGLEALPVDGHGPALAELFRRAHEVLEGQEDLAGLSGSTATAAVVNATTGTLTTAFVGDSRLLLVRGAEVAFETIDHTIGPKDVARVVACGGEVRENLTANDSPRHVVSRIFIKGTNRPGLAMSRSLGDLEAHKIGTLAEPEIKTGLSFGQDDTLVIGSDGVWEKIDPQEALLVVGQDPQEAVRSLVHEAHSRWPHNPDGDVDDITAVVVRLQAPLSPGTVGEPSLSVTRERIDIDVIEQADPLPTHERGGSRYLSHIVDGSWRDASPTNYGSYIRPQVSAKWVEDNLDTPCSRRSMKYTEGKLAEVGDFRLSNQINLANLEQISESSRERHVLSEAAKKLADIIREDD